MNPGTLYIIASPIGNPEDMTIRALKLLGETIDIVYCEDTRQTGRLLSHHGISRPLRSLHAHSDDAKIMQLVDEIRSGKNIGYMTDSGTPGMSDPGSKIVAIARREGVAVIPLPGVSALTTIVSVSGFPDKNILFGGFLSKKPGRRKNELSRMREHEGIIVIYESPHRIKKVLADIAEIFPDREIFIGREMTKKFEEFIALRGDTIPSMLENLKDMGEFAIAIFNKELKFAAEEDKD
ncbi:MAG: 16S rRNA (cytidine(1402)-2'-O)-methyltransferase [Spirochaetes bacterium]|mgnify:CR=1 FL=1|nr:16S rRNA (cytidine(1402)-2'-O)-methyltransferase [Spirochaetota bacterium]